MKTLRVFCCICIICIAVCGSAAQPKKALLIVERARLEAIRQVAYDGSYRKISYPNGDVPASQGTCVEVIIRGLRAAGYDLQRLIHEDKRRNPGKYPKIGGSRRLDSNIDHRRCANQIVFMKRHGKTLTTKLDKGHLAEWQAGDLVYIDLDPGKGQLLHCGVVSDQKTPSGRPFLIHNCGPTANEEDFLATGIKILYHFRFPRPELTTRRPSAAESSVYREGIHSNAPVP